MQDIHRFDVDAASIKLEVKDHGQPLLWTQSATSRSPSSKTKVPQVNPITRPARDPEKQGAHAKPSGDLVSRDQTRNKSPDSSRVPTRDKS